MLLRNGTLVTPEGLFEGNVYAEGGKISAITRWDVAWEAHQTENVSGKLVFPGAIDVHVHLNDPGYTWREDFQHGTLAAAAGGVTTVLDMPLQNEPALTSASLFHAKHKAVQGKARVNYGFWGGLADDVPDKDKMEALRDAGAVAFKIFIGPVSPDYRSLPMGTVREVLRKAATLDVLVGFHAEDFSIIKHEEARAQREGRQGRIDFLRSRPLSAELIAVENVIELVRETGAKAHICHVSHPQVAERVRRARSEGLPLSAETCTHYLVFSEDDFLREGMLFKCAPPLRDRDSMETLWDYVADGTLQCVASDHSPCALREKDEKDGAFTAWGGISGIQTTLQVLYDNAVRKRHWSPELLARCLSREPARLFGLYGRKGALEVGFDADMTVFDPEREWEITPNSLFYLNKISAFTGLKGKGQPVMTFVHGKLAFRDGEDNGFGGGRLEKRGDT